MDVFCGNLKSFQNLALGFSVRAFIQTIEDDDVRDFMWINAIVKHFIERTYDQRKYLGFKRPQKNNFVSLNGLSNTSAILRTPQSKLIHQRRYNECFVIAARCMSIKKETSCQPFQLRFANFCNACGNRSFSRTGWTVNP